MWLLNNETDTATVFRISTHNMPNAGGRQLFIAKPCPSNAMPSRFFQRFIYLLYTFYFTISNFANIRTYIHGQELFYRIGYTFEWGSDYDLKGIIFDHLVLYKKFVFWWYVVLNPFSKLKLKAIHLFKY